MTTEETERFLAQLLVWRGVVGGLSDVSRRALWQALAEVEVGTGDPLEWWLRRHAVSLREVA